MGSTCRAKAPVGLPYHCTQEKGHAGDHVAAGMYNDEYARWPDESAVDTEAAAKWHCMAARPRRILLDALRGPYVPAGRADARSIECLCRGENPLLIACTDDAFELTARGRRVATYGAAQGGGK